MHDEIFNFEKSGMLQFLHNLFTLLVGGSILYASHLEISLCEQTTFSR
jgi:hypothetical protein